MERAVNPQTGEVLFLVNNQWMPPSQVAKNDKGDTAYLVANQWQIVPGAQAPEPAPGGLETIAPKPTTPNAMTGTEYLQQLAKREEKQPERTVKGSVIDAGVTFLKGAIGLPEAFVGLADIPSGGTIGKLLEDIGYKPKEAKEILDTYLSEAQQYANRQLKETKGFLPTIGTAIQNPSTIATAVGESLPQMLGGAGIARGIIKAVPGIAPYIAGAAGEGLLGAGSAAEQMRQDSEDRLLTGKQALSAVGSGVGTAAFGVAGGKLAKKLGLDDVDTLLAGGTAQGSKSVKDFAKKATYSGISEGVFEEMPQSAQEQMWMNYATDKPLLEGVPEAAGMGVVTGAAMGVGATGLAGRSKEQPKTTPTEKPIAEAAAPTPTPVVEPKEPPTAPPPSATQDTEAMLREALGETIPAAQEKPVEAAAPAEEVTPEAEKPAATISPVIVEKPKEEAPKEEAAKEEAPTLKEQYDKAAKMNFMAGDAFRNQLISQEQLDKIRSDYERIKAEYQATIPKGELSPIQQEATEIADKLEALGLKPFADGMRTSIEKDQVKEQNLEFYRAKLKQEQAKAPKAEENVERPSEKWDWSKFYGDDTKGLEKLKLFNSKAKPEIKQALQTLSESIQAVTDRLNDEGYTMYGPADLNAPKEIKDLRNQIQLRSAEGSLLINKFEALNKGFNRSKKTSNQENLDRAIADAKAGAAEAQKSLQRSVPEPEEIAGARADIAAANKRIESLEYKSGSLWSALMGKLDPEEVREIFGPNPSLGEKKLQVTKKSGKRGTYISEMAANGTLDPFLPPAMRHESSRFDAAESAQYIKDAVANKDYLPHDVKAEIEDIYRGVEPLGDLIDEYLTIEEQNRELQIAADEQREADQAAEIVEPEGKNRPAERGEGPALELTAPTADELKAKQDEIDRLTKENERLAKEAEAKAKADEEAKDFVLTGSNREADVAAARGQKDIFGEPIEEAPVKEKAKEPQLSLEYTKALDESREATREFGKAQEAYRAQQIDDDEFLIARKKYDLAIAQFDRAFKQEQNKPAKKAKPEVAEEVLPAVEEEAAGALGFEPYTIEGDFTEVAEEQQRLMLENQTENLSDAQVATLEKHYGSTIDTDEFFTKLREDVSNFIVRGATAVNGKIRAIIRQLANGLLSVAIAFNPQYMSQPLNVFMPTDNVRTEEVLATVPDAATDKMSEPAKRAFAVIYPAIQEQMQAKDKLFIVADKPSGRVFVFNPDGSLLLDKKSLFGLAKGDIYVGDNDKPQNRITPAGLFDLKLVDAKKGESEKRTAGDYDTGTVLAINDPDGTITIMHSVWLKEKDAAQRAAALRNESAADSRYSFGCINVDAPTYKFLVDNHYKQMDGAALFIVPEAGADVMSFITGKGAMSEDLARIKVKPVTKTIKTPQKQATPAEAKTKVPGKEEEIFMSVEPQTKTAAFKKWFGDSKVVDANGKPLVVYHGTLKNFEKFNTDAKNQLGAHFASSPAIANQFANNEEGAVVYPAYLSLQNPYDMGNDLGDWSDVEALKEYLGPAGEGPFSQKQVNAWNTASDVVSALKNAGYDGIVYDNLFEGENKGIGNSRSFIAFDPEQIKSATGNRGAFDESANINMDLGDSLVKLVDQMADGLAEDEKKRSPSLKRQLKTYNRQRKAGKMSDEMYVMMSDAAIREDEENQLKKEPKDRERGYLHIQEKMSAAVRRGEMTREAYDLANWFMLQNEALVDDLGISIQGKGPAGAGGFYNNLNRVITLIKESSNDLTATHEILHHLERMMPAKIQAAIRKAWLTQLTKAQKSAKSPAEKLYFEALMDAHFGANNASLLNVPEGAGNEYAAARSSMEDSGKTGSLEIAKQLLMMEFVPIEDYQYFNPSEFWAVNGSRIVLNRYNAVDRGLVNKLKNWLRELGQKMKSIFGLKSDASIIRALDSLAKADGKFVTDEMLGQGDFLNIKQNFRGGEMPKATWAMEESSLFGDWIQKFQDNYRDLKVVQKIITDQIGKIDDRLNAYRKETLNPGREAEQAGEFLKYEVEPLVKEMRDNNVSNQELATYLHNRYAEERNEIINAKNKNPAVQDQGSGISTENARKYLKELPADRKQVLESLAARIDDIVRGSQDILVGSGQETKETIDSWRKESPHYVPLKRDESELDFIVQTGSGNLGGFATAGKFGKEALGSTKTVVNILENVMLQRDRAIRRAESIRIGQALYGMAIKYPNPDFWMAINPDAIKDMDALVAEMEAMGLDPEMIDNLLEQPKTGVISKSTGPEGETVRDVKYRVSRSYQNARNVFPIRINGQNRFVLFNPKSKEAMRLAAELKQLDAEKLGIFFGAASTLSRWFAAVNTQYNPAFGLVNIINDTQGALVNLSTTPLAGQQMDVLRSVKPALFGIAKDIRKERKQTKKSVIKTKYDPDNIKPEDWTSLWRLFRQAGGKTGFRDQMVRQKMNVEWKGLVPSVSFEDEHAMLKAMEKLEQGPIRQKVEWWADAFSDFNDTLENTVRLAVFKVAYVDNKMSAEEAADIAKNITVNFNKRGAKTKMIRGLYAFFNASVQGTARYAITLAGPAGSTIVKTGLTMGAINALWMFMAGFDDDDPPQFTKNKGFIVPTGGGDYFIWNLPPGLRAIPNTGRLLTEGMLISLGLTKSNRGMSGKIMDAGSVMIDAINPFGGGTFLQTISPTFLDPAMALAENKDSFGRPIFKEDQALKPKPGWQRTRDTASSFSKGLAWFLNYVSSGGEEFSKGFLSPTGDQLDYLIGQAAGGVGREAKRLVELGVNMAEGEKTPAYRVPLANRFLGETKTEAATAARFYDNVKMLAEHQNIINGRIENKGDVAGYYKQNPMAKYAFAGDEFENDVNGLNKSIRDLQKQPDTKENRESIKQMKAARVQLMETLNGLVRKAQ